MSSVTRASRIFHRFIKGRPERVTSKDKYAQAEKYFSISCAARDMRQCSALLSAKAAAQSRAEKRAKKILAEMPLNELRAARQLTQESLAKSLGINQAAVSKMERRTDMYISTLRQFVVAMGGELEITARFPDGAIRILQFEDA
ncbi:MAG TPA: XRE family transcriptional regulator [Pyrinomonadaceae bacterium]|nr:XRE family transcriptional regulator [Pyrinomonadaceae bacterium]